LAHQAAAVVSILQQLLKHIGVCHGKMEYELLRCDLKISVAPITPVLTTNAQHELNHSRTICYGGKYVSSLPVNCGK
jgi:Asp-tRNA(Asn)/Glu-tRNA(Gln) amidotransferase B subunit